jgi:hypothetical protein
MREWQGYASHDAYSRVVACVAAMRCRGAVIREPVVGRQEPDPDSKLGVLAGNQCKHYGGMYTRTCCFRAGCGGKGTCESSLLRTGGGPERGVPAAAADLRLMGVDAIVVGAPPTVPKKIIQKIKMYLNVKGPQKLKHKVEKFSCMICPTRTVWSQAHRRARENKVTRAPWRPRASCHAPCCRVSSAAGRQRCSSTFWRTRRFDTPLHAYWRLEAHSSAHAPQLTCSRSCQTDAQPQHVRARLPYTHPHWHLSLHSLARIGCIQALLVTTC